MEFSPVHLSEMTEERCKKCFCARCAKNNEICFRCPRGNIGEICFKVVLSCRGFVPRKKEKKQKGGEGGGEG